MEKSVFDSVIMKNAFIIGIAGGSGSGKSTFAKRLYRQFPNDIALVSCDNYYFERKDMSFEQRKQLNYDSPDAFEFDLMVDQILKLKSGEDVNCPVYDFVNHNRSDKVLEIKSRPIILIDGILIFSQASLRDIMDMKIYVETDADERILRRVKRDISERGRELDNIIEQYLSTVKPMHNTYVEPTKAFADIIVNGGMNDIAFDIVKTKIEQLLKITEE